MQMEIRDPQELIDLVSIWTFELLDNSIGLENYFELERTLLRSSKALEAFRGSLRLHRELIGMFNDTPEYLETGLQRAIDLAKYVESEINFVAST